MKNQAFTKRAKHAVDGWRVAFNNENSFRTQCLAALFAFAATALLAPSALWWALITVLIALVLAAELLNTALEHLADGLHPEQALFVKNAKDCAAGAVLVLSIAAGIVFLLMLSERL